jgi:ABC-type phosphate transport system substrate-binding protein
MANKPKQTPNTLGYTNTSYKEKMTQMTEQEKIIEEKKRKILEKMKAEEIAAVTQNTAAASTTPPVYVNLKMSVKSNLYNQKSLRYSITLCKFTVEYSTNKVFQFSGCKSVF